MDLKQQKVMKLSPHAQESASQLKKAHNDLRYNPAHIKKKKMVLKSESDS